MEDRPQARSPAGRLMALSGSPYLHLAIGSLFWTGNILLGRAVHLQMSPMSLAFWRWTMAAVMILSFTGPRLWAHRVEFLRKWRFLLAMAILGVALFHWMYYKALNLSTAVNVSIISSVTPIAIVCISWLALRERVTQRQLIGIIVSIAGVLVIITRGELAVLLRLNLNRGDLWALATVPCWGVYTVLLRRHRTIVDPMTELSAIILIGAVLLTPFYLWELATEGLFEVNPATLGTIVYISLFGSIVAYVLWNRSVEAVGPNKAGLFLHLIPVFTTVLAILFLGERMFLYHGAGIAMIVLGIYLVTAQGLPAAAAESAR